MNFLCRASTDLNIIICVIFLNLLCVNLSFGFDFRNLCVHVPPWTDVAFSHYSCTIKSQLKYPVQISSATHISNEDVCVSEFSMIFGDIFHSNMLIMEMRKAQKLTCCAIVVSAVRCCAPRPQHAAKVLWNWICCVLRLRCTAARSGAGRSKSFMKQNLLRSARCAQSAACCVLRLYEIGPWLRHCVRRVQRPYLFQVRRWNCFHW